MARISSLGDLLKESADTLGESSRRAHTAAEAKKVSGRGSAPVVPEQEWPSAPASTPEAATIQPTTPAPVEPETSPEPERNPHGKHYYLDLVRKELRVHPEQATQLSILTMQIQNAKRRKGERITDNTLYRIAVDLLLQRKDELHGTTEDELRNSVGLPPL